MVTSKHIPPLPPHLPPLLTHLPPLFHHLPLLTPPSHFLLVLLLTLPLPQDWGGRLLLQRPPCPLLPWGPGIGPPSSEETGQGEAPHIHQAELVHQHPLQSTPPSSPPPLLPSHELVTLHSLLLYLLSLLLTLHLEPQGGHPLLSFAVNFLIFFLFFLFFVHLALLQVNNPVNLPTCVAPLPRRHVGLPFPSPITPPPKSFPQSLPVPQLLLPHPPPPHPVGGRPGVPGVLVQWWPLRSPFGSLFDGAELGQLELVDMVVGAEATIELTKLNKVHSPSLDWWWRR